MEAAPQNNVNGRPRRGGHRMRRAQIPAFGNWDYNDQHQQQVPISQYFDFDYCATKPEPVLLLHSSVYPYAHSYSPAYAAYVDDDQHPHYNPSFHAAGSYNNHYDAHSFQPHFDHFNIKTTSSVATEVKGSQSGAQTRPQRQRRSYLGVDNNNRKVFDITEAIPSPAPALTDKCYGNNNDVVVVTPDLYDVGSANVTIGKDEDLYKIPPELLSKSKRNKKMRRFFTKCFVTICASY